jgi:chromo domain-containing protein 1
MPGLNNLLQFPINIFNISLRHPIDGFGGRLQRLFPSGGVILMTEDVILHETSAALDILRWFASYLDRTREWKMFFPPNILQWLLNLFDTWSDDK